MASRRAEEAFKREAKRRSKLVEEGRCVHCEIILKYAPGHDCLRSLVIHSEDLLTPQGLAI